MRGQPSDDSRHAKKNVLPPLPPPPQQGGLLRVADDAIGVLRYTVPLFGKNIFRMTELLDPDLLSDYCCCCCCTPPRLRDFIQTIRTTSAVSSTNSTGDTHLCKLRNEYTGIYSPGFTLFSFIEK